MTICLVDLTHSRAIDFRLPDAVLSEETPGEKFSRSDANNDEKLSFDEFLHMELPYVLMKRTEFGGYDANEDGFISKAEYDSKLHRYIDKYDGRRAHYFGKIYADYDENFDMKLSKDEVTKMISNRFQLKPGSNFNEIYRSFDADKDGGLDIDEYMKFDDDMPLDEFVPDESRSPGPPRPSVHCDDEEDSNEVSTVTEETVSSMHRTTKASSSHGNKKSTAHHH